MPFTTLSWMAILLSCLIISVLFSVVPNYRKVNGIIPLLLISILLEESFDINGRQFKLRSYRLVVGFFILLAVVLSNGYKGVVITSLVKPFEAVGVESLEVAIELGYTSIGRHSGFISEYCCAEGIGLNTNIAEGFKFFDNPAINVGVVQTCGDAMVFEEQFEIITSISWPLESTFTLVDQIISSGRIKNFNEENMTSGNGRVLMKLAKATEAHDCKRT